MSRLPDHQLPPSWITAQIADVAEINPRLDKSEIEDWPEVTFVPMSAIEAGTGGIDIRATRPAGEVKKGYTPFRQGDVLFAKITPCMENGKMAVVPTLPNGLGFGSTEFHVLRSLGGVSAKFLYYFVSSQQFRFDAEHNMTGAVGQRRVPTTYISDHPIYLPASNEQRRIVAKIEELFSELDKGVESLKTVRAQLKLYRQAVLKHAFEGKLTAQWREENKDKLETAEQVLARIAQAREANRQRELAGCSGPKPTRPNPPKESPPIAMEELAALPNLPVGWRYVRLSEIARIGSGMSVSKSRTVEDPIDVRYLRVANVQRGRLELSDITTMQIERSHLPRLALKQWDVLFNEGGDRDKLGRGWVWECQIHPCITQNHVFRASPYLPSETHAKFLSHWGNTFGQGYFDQKGKQTTNLASINKSTLGDFPVPVTYFEEQTEILASLDRQITVLDQLEAEIANGFRKIESLRQSILKKAFSGQLVAQEPNDEPASVLLERIRAEKAAQAEKPGREPRKRAGRSSAETTAPGA